MSRPHLFQRPQPPRQDTTQGLPTAILEQVRHARALQERGRGDEAAAIYRAVLTAWPRQFECLHYLGVAELNAGRVDEAVRLLDLAIDVQPAEAAAHSNLAAALLAQGRLDAALARVDHALSLKASSAEAQSTRGWILHRLGRHDEAIAALERAIALNPRQVRHVARGVSILIETGQLPRALEWVDRLFDNDATTAMPHANRARILQLMGRSADARTTLQQAIALEPANVVHRLKHALSWLPLARDSDDTLADDRARFGDELGALAEALAGGEWTGLAEAVGDAQPYYLAYQAFDNTALLARCGRVATALMSRWLAARPTLAQAAAASRVADPATIRVGIVSAHVRTHSVWNAITRGIVEHLDRERFHVHVFHLGEVEDAQTTLARDRADAFTDGKRDLDGWVRTILAAGCDLLLYPELGMDPMTARLAALRLAPLQVASWGHPQTTGLPTIDAFLSSELMEPGDADAHYTEQLVRLPGLGCHFRALDAAPPARDDDVLATLPAATGTDALFVCPGAAIKYTPRHDALWVRIARELPSARFVFFRNRVMAALTDRTIERTRRSFAAAGLDPDAHVLVLPWQSEAAFQSLMARATAMLDTVDFSGFNTVMHAVEAGVPIVTQRGRYLRGRLGSAILDRLGLPVAASDDDYVAMAVRLARDPRHASEMREGLVQRRGALHEDERPLRALEAWIEGRVRGPGA